MLPLELKGVNVYIIYHVYMYLNRCWITGLKQKQAITKLDYNKLDYHKFGLPLFVCRKIY